MIASLAPERGRMAVIVSLGVLFRGGAERQIREHLVKENLIDAVIALPPKMLANTGIQTAILVLRRKKADDGILFIDAGRSYQQGKILNVLREPDLDQIETTYQARINVDQYSKLASQTEVAGNDYNLSVARYVEILEEEEELDLASLRAERAVLRSELERLEEKACDPAEGDRPCLEHRQLVAATIASTCVSRRLISVQTWRHEPSSPSAREANTTSMLDQNLTNTAATQTCTQAPSKRPQATIEASSVLPIVLWKK
ncbi:N-6 DNA methylase [Pseudomonas aeruginosa]|nr:N-6 DNA methylase [Pseudomonas aeruginosa]